CLSARGFKRGPRSVRPTGINMSSAGEIERAIAAFARSPNGGLIVTGSALANIHRKSDHHAGGGQKLPATYFERLFVTAGGLISYGPDFLDQYRRAAGYVDHVHRRWQHALTRTMRRRGPALTLG